nr:MFS transporter [Vulcanimicrobium alpinum]
MPYAILVVAAILVELAVNLPTGSLPLALIADGVGPTGIAVVAAIAALAPLLGSVPVGGLVDRFGRVRAVRIAAVVSAAALLALAWVHGPAGAAGAMALRSLAITALVTAEFAYASAIVREDRAVSAVATLGMVGNLSLAVSPALGVWLWQHGVGREQFVWGALPAGPWGGGPAVAAKAPRRAGEAVAADLHALRMVTGDDVPDRRDVGRRRQRRARGRHAAPAWDRQRRAAVHGGRRDDVLPALSRRTDGRPLRTAARRDPHRGVSPRGVGAGRDGAQRCDRRDLRNLLRVRVVGDGPGRDRVAV